MRLRFRGHTYDVIFKRRFIPVGIIEIIPDFYEAPSDYKLTVNGNKLSGKVALITGAHKGIGYHIAIRLLKEGAKVIITGRDEDALRSTIQKLGTPNVAYLVWDITDGKESEHLNEAVKIFGDINILVNNAGVNKVKGRFMGFEDATKEYIHSIHDINVLSTVRICECFVSKYSSGTILNIISNTAVRAAIGVYWMSKWAIYDYTKGLSEKLQHCSNITVNGLCPGPTKTNMMFNENSSIYLPNMANKRFGLPEEIAEMAFVQIVSGLKGQSGEITVCDGGESLV